MRLIRLTFVLSVLTVCVAAAQATDHQVGTWKLNAAKSKFADASMAPKSAVTTITAAPGGGVKVSVANTNTDGSPVKYSFTAKYDGKDYPVMGDPNRDTVAYTKKDEYTFEVVSKLKGNVTSRATVAYSKDGKTRTITVSGTNAQGQAGTNVQVYERQ
jgi:hypothetical protein